MLKERPGDAARRGSHRGKAEEIERRLRLLGAKEEPLVTAALRRRRGDVQIALVSSHRLEMKFQVLEADGTSHPWLVVVDLVERPGWVTCEELEKGIRRWLREFRNDPGAKLEVRGQTLRMSPVTAYPIGR